MSKLIITFTILLVLVLVGIGVFKFIYPQEETLQPGLVVQSPKFGAELTSPVAVTGYVNGEGWIGFEGQVGTVALLDEKNEQIGLGILTAKGEWMTIDPIYFEAQFTYQKITDGSGILIFRNENPSGLSENDRTFSLPVTIKASGETTTLKVYFGKEGVTGSTCKVVFAQDRIVPKTQAVARVALEELLKGPTAEEKVAGYFSGINPGVKIQSLTLDGTGTLRVDFDEELERGVGGSCRVAEIRSEISFTLKQFPSVKDVIISIDGRTEDILQP